jgi:GNAT superfamily N-acetyltransferase
MRPSPPATLSIHELRDADGDRFAAVANRALPARPRSAEFFLYARRRFQDTTHWMARLDGADAGIALLTRFPWAGEPGLLEGDVRVVPQARRRGVGSALLAAVLASARDRGATMLDGSYLDDEPDARAFAEQHGFVPHDRMRRVALEVAEAPGDLRPHPPGIEVVSLAERPDLLGAIYRVDRVTVHDIPSSTPPTPLDYDEWRDLVTEGPGFRADGLFAALDGDQVVAYAMVAIDVAAPTRAWHNMTAVLPDHRGRGIAQALKRATIVWARQSGIERLITANHDANAPMRAINRKLGYQAEPDEIIVRLELALPGRA